VSQSNSINVQTIGFFHQTICVCYLIFFGISAMILISMLTAVLVRLNGENIFVIIFDILETKSFLFQLAGRGASSSKNFQMMAKTSSLLILIFLRPNSILFQHVDRVRMPKPGPLGKTGNGHVKLARSH
jgi:hypothetical protein